MEETELIQYKYQKPTIRLAEEREFFVQFFPIFCLRFLHSNDKKRKELHFFTSQELLSGNGGEPFRLQLHLTYFLAGAF